MSKSCKCCGHPSAIKYGDYSACNMCKPREPEERITEANINDNGKVRKARVREVTYRCTSALCDKKIIFARSNFVQEWLE